MSQSLAHLSTFEVTMHKKQTHMTPSGHSVSKRHSATPHPAKLEIQIEQNGKPPVTEDEIRTLAHAKWQAAGCPPGDGLEFWLSAEQELTAQGSHNGEHCGR
jgi:hypothetical protein